MSRILSLVLVCAGAVACGSSPSSPLAPASVTQPAVVTNGGGTDAGEAARGPVLSANETRFSGRVEVSPDDAAANTLLVAGRTVVVSTSTTIKNGSQIVAASSLAVDTLLDVVGVQGETTFAARLIDVLRDPQVQADGTVSGLAGTASSFTFTLDGRSVRGTSATEFKGGPNPSFARLGDGVAVHVTADDKGTYLQATRVILQEVEDPAAPEVKLTGTIAAMTGTAPALTLTVGTSMVLTNAATVVRRKNDTLTLAALEVGQTVEVTGTADADGAIIATRIQIEGGAAAPAPPAASFDATGTISARTGTCPAVTFTLNGKTVTTSATTSYVQLDCAALVDGAKVRVKGSMNGDAVSATWVKKEK